MSRLVEHQSRLPLHRLLTTVTALTLVAALAAVGVLAITTGAARTASPGPRGPAVADLTGLVPVSASSPVTARRKSAINVRVGTFNVLGSQHTARGGDRSGFPGAKVRSARAARLIAAHRVDILGTQELQQDQLAALTSRTGMAAYPGLRWGPAETDNSILYDKHRFKLVSGGRFVIPFMGHRRPQPILRLKERATGRQLYVVNTHPSAHGGRYATERRRGQAALVRVVKRLHATGLPVLVTGDMNDREKFFCRVVPRARLVAANGGSYAKGCHPPRSPIPVDWVVGTRDVSWRRYWRDTRPVERRISDHFLVSATAHVR